MNSLIKKEFVKSHFEVSGILLFLGLFLITLQSFYFPFIGSGLTILGLLILVILSLNSLKLNHSYVVFSIVCISILIFHALLSASKYFSVSDTISAFATILMIAALPFIQSLASDKKGLIKKALKWTIIIHVLLLSFQVLYWLMTKEYFDLFDVFMGLDSRVNSKKGITFDGIRVPRFSGLFNEPGTYSVTIMSLTIVYYFLVSKINTTMVIASISSLATMSMFGVVLVAMLFSFSLIFNDNNRVKIFIYGVLLLLLFYLFGGVEALLLRFSDSSGYSGIDFRSDMITSFFMDIEDIIFGIRIDDLPSYYVVNDVGLWFAFIVNYGVFGGIVIFFILSFSLYRTHRFTSILLILILLQTKLKFTYPLFWVLLVFVMNSKYANHKTE